jgi:hypothetical protein
VLATAVLGGPLGKAGTEEAGRVSGIDRVTDKTDIAVRAVAAAVPVGRLPSMPTGYSHGRSSTQQVVSCVYEVGMYVRSLGSLW